MLILVSISSSVSQLLEPAQWWKIQNSIWTSYSFLGKDGKFLVFVPEELCTYILGLQRQPVVFSPPQREAGSGSEPPSSWISMWPPPVAAACGLVFSQAGCRPLPASFCSCSLSCDPWGDYLSCLDLSPGDDEEREVEGFASYGAVIGLSKDL